MSSPLVPTASSRIRSGTPAGSPTRNLAAMPAPQWFFRFMYDRESTAWGRRRDQPEHRELVEQAVDELAKVVVSPGPVADLGRGPGAHTLALAWRVTTSLVSTGHHGWSRSRGHEPPATVSTPCSSCMKSDPIRSRSRTSRSERSSRDSSSSTSGILPISSPRSAAASGEGGHLSITAPARDSTPATSQNLYWRLRTAFYVHVPGVVHFYDTSSFPPPPSRNRA